MLSAELVALCDALEQWTEGRRDAVCSLRRSLPLSLEAVAVALSTEVLVALEGTNAGCAQRLDTGCLLLGSALGFSGSASPRTHLCGALTALLSSVTSCASQTSALRCPLHLGALPPAAQANLSPWGPCSALTRRPGGGRDSCPGPARPGPWGDVGFSEEGAFAPGAPARLGWLWSPGVGAGLPPGGPVPDPWPSEWAGAAGPWKSYGLSEELRLETPGGHSGLP